MNKNEILKAVTAGALSIDVIGFVLLMKYGLEGFETEYLIMWASAQIWLVLFVTINCLCKRKNKKVTNNTDTYKRINKDPEFKMYQLTK